LQNRLCKKEEEKCLSINFFRTFAPEFKKKEMEKFRTEKKSSFEKAIEDIEAGRVYEAKDVDDLFAQCLGD